MIKPGWQTTEWWTTVLTNIAALITALHPGFTTGPWVAPLAMAAAGISTAVYSIVRGQVKTAAATPPVSSPPAPTAATDLAHALTVAAAALTPPPAPAA